MELDLDLKLLHVYGLIWAYHESLELDLDLKLLHVYGLIWAYYENLELDLDLKLLFMALYGHIMNVVQLLLALQVYELG